MPFLQLWKYAERKELAINALGLFCAIAAGVLEPMFTIFFGKLTNAFVEYSKAVSSGVGLEEAKHLVRQDVNKQVLALLYIAIGTAVAVFTYMWAFVSTGERITRRVRERYLKGVLRQNVAYFDTLSAGAITTRITSDTHLLQVGISEKVALTVSYVAQFIGGFVISIAVSWRVGLVCASAIP